ncbi:deleted in malignant brain tumors 1 protein-like [Arapaima gigas]
MLVVTSLLICSLAAHPGSPAPAHSQAPSDPPCVLPESRRLRLVDSDDGSSCSGLLELKHNSTWLHLCAKSWNEAMTLLACSDMRCGKPISHYFISSGTFFPGVELTCYSQETSLLHCAKKEVSCITRVGVSCVSNPGVTEHQECVSTTESPFPVAVGPLQWVRVGLVLFGLAALVFSVIAVELLARRHRGEPS